MIMSSYRQDPTQRGSLSVEQLRFGPQRPEHIRSHILGQTRAAQTARHPVDQWSVAVEKLGQSIRRALQQLRDEQRVWSPSRSTEGP